MNIVIVDKESNKPLRGFNDSVTDFDKIIDSYMVEGREDVFLVSEEELSIDYSSKIVNKNYRIFEDGTVTNVNE